MQAQVPAFAEVADMLMACNHCIDTWCYEVSHHSKQCTFLQDADIGGHSCTAAMSRKVV